MVRAGIASWRVADNHIVQAELQVLVSRMLYRHLRCAYAVTGWVFQVCRQQAPVGVLTASVYRSAGPAVDNQLYSIELANEPGARRPVDQVRTL